MEKETSTSKEDLIKKLIYVADLVKEKYNVSIWFAEILGKRWSYIAGQKEGEISLLPPERIELSERFGIVSDMWERIPVNERKKLISSLKETIKYG
ncbi:MAG: hypothetical protein HQ573_00890 [Desulfobacteraceae bacterium]|nr:hypothetical protein [Desulfobacteraceae bacterium]